MGNTKSLAKKEVDASFLEFRLIEATINETTSKLYVGFDD